MTVQPTDDAAVTASAAPVPDLEAGPSTVFGPVEVVPETLRTVTRDGLAVSTTARGSTLTVGVAGELLQETAAVFTGVVDGFAEDPAVTVVLVDLTATSFMDSTGLGSLVTLHNRVVHRGGTVRLVRPTDRVFRLFELTRLDTFFEFAD